MSSAIIPESLRKSIITVLTENVSDLVGPEFEKAFTKRSAIDINAKIVRERKILETFIAVKINEVAARIVSQLIEDRIRDLDNKIGDIIDSKLSFVTAPFDLKKDGQPVTVTHSESLAPIKPRAAVNVVELVPIQSQTEGDTTAVAKPGAIYTTPKADVAEPEANVATVIPEVAAVNEVNAPAAVSIHTDDAVAVVTNVVVPATEPEAVEVIRNKQVVVASEPYAPTPVAIPKRMCIGGRKLK